jgi:hypothetical protein
MSNCDPPQASEIVDLWRRRFGEPPAILTDAETMLRILNSMPPRSFAPDDAPEAPAAIAVLDRARLDDAAVGGVDTTP